MELLVRAVVGLQAQVAELTQLVVRRRQAPGATAPSPAAEQAQAVRLRARAGLALQRAAEQTPVVVQ